MIQDEDGDIRESTATKRSNVRSKGKKMVEESPRIKSRISGIDDHNEFEQIQLEMMQLQSMKEKKDEKLKTQKIPKSAL
jgi:hypothetical protein